MPHKLLLADDSVTIQRVIELTFADEDVQVFAVGDGKKAIEAVQASRPDIVLADVGMPERDGYEVAAFIKGNPEFAHIPVLLLTGAFEPIDETRARAVGCDGVLVKPFEPQMVINRVKDLLAGRRPAGLWSANPLAQMPSRPSAQPGTVFDLRADAVPPATAAGPGAGPGGSLEDYFDRLDAAFATLDGDVPASAPSAPAARAASAPAASAPASPAFRGDEVAGWDPDLSGDPTRPVPVEPPPIDIDPPVFARPGPVRPAPLSPPWTSPELSAPQSSGHAAASSAPALLYVPGPASTAPSATAPLAAALPMPSLAEAFAALLSAEQNMSFAPSGVRPAGGGGGVSESMVEEIIRRVVARMTDQAVKSTVVEVAERLVREEIERIKGR